MEVKGVGIILTRQYVKSKFATGYEEWLDSLSPGSRELVERAISSTWYPVETAFLEPTQKICDLFYGGKLEGAWHIGRYCAEHALKGVYGAFMKEGDPEFVVSRTRMVFSYYYRPCEIEIVENSSKRAILRIARAATPSALIDQRMGGWMERALEMTGAILVTAEITRSAAQGADATELVIRWSQPLDARQPAAAR